MKIASACFVFVTLLLFPAPHVAGQKIVAAEPAKLITLKFHQFTVAYWWSVGACKSLSRYFKFHPGYGKWRHFTGFCNCGGAVYSNNAFRQNHTRHCRHTESEFYIMPRSICPGCLCSLNFHVNDYEILSSVYGEKLTV